MKILVTGSTGGIGRFVVKRLLETGHTVRAVDLTAQPSHPDFEYLPGDIRDLPFLRRAISGVEAVIHLAAIPYDMEGMDDLVLDTNLRGTYNVLLSAQEAGVRRVVNFSSINALGQAEEGHPALSLPLDDSVPSYTIHNYPLTKHLGEEMCRAFAARGSMTAVSLRPTLVTHPGPSRHRWWDFLPEEWRMRSLIGDFWSYVDVRDVAEAAVLALSADIKGHQAFLLSADDNRTHTPTAEVVAQHYPHLPWPRIVKEDYLARGEFVTLLNCDAAKQVLGWQPRFSRFDPSAGYED